MVLECRLFGEVVKEDVRRLQEALDVVSLDIPQRFRFRETLFTPEPLSRAFQKTVRLRKPVPFLTFDHEIQTANESQGLGSWDLIVEGAPVRGLEWTGCLVRDVQEMSCMGTEASLVALCRSTFQLKQGPTLLHFGSRYQIRKDDFEITVTILRSHSGLDTSSRGRPVSEMHYLVDMMAKVSSKTLLKGVVQSMHKLKTQLEPWVNSTLV